LLGGEPGRGGRRLICAAERAAAPGGEQMSEHEANETPRAGSPRPRWLRAALAGTAVGVLAVGIAVAMHVGDGAGSTAGGEPRAAAAAPISTPPTEPPSTDPANVVSRTITVTGRGTATVEPDLANVQLGVNVQQPTANAALQRANASAAALIDALEGAGVAKDDIVTSNLSIWPQYGDQSRITGYTASNSVSVTVRDITKTGPVVDAAASAAGDDIAINGISFGLDDPEQVLSAARADAVANAAKRAGEFAAAAGARVGTVLQISETAVTPYEPRVYAADGAAATSAAGTAPTPIRAGTTDVSVTVDVVYALG
jgi:uncharacterized protein YggE